MNDCNNEIVKQLKRIRVRVTWLVWLTVLSFLLVLVAI